MIFNRKLSKKPEPNEECWCGSGKKYKKCHRIYDIETDKYRSQGFTILPTALLKTDADIEGIRQAGVITRGILDMLTHEAKEGVTTQRIDDLVYTYTKDHGGIPATLNYNGFPKSCCTSINQVVCHGIPTESRTLQAGDIVNIDITTILNGYFADSSRMYCIGEVADNAKQIVEAAKQCLQIGIDQVKPYERLNNIGDAIDTLASRMGYSVVRDLCGHGIGKEFHEDPEILHYAQPKRKGVLMVPGMVFTIEPMINEGTHKCNFLNDGWTVETADGKLSAQWEHTLVVTNTGYEILT